MKRITRTASTTLAAAALLLTSGAAALAAQPGLVDGWYDPTEGTVVTVADDVEAAPAVTCSGLEPGLPDGCWVAEGTVIASGGISAAGAGLVPANVR